MIPCCPDDLYAPTSLTSQQKIVLWVRIGLAIVLTVQSMMLALSVNLSSSTSAERWAIHLVLLVMTAFVFLLLGTPLVHNTIRQVIRFRLSYESLFISGILGALGYSILQMGTTDGAVYFEVINVLLLVYYLGNRMKADVQARVINAIRHYLDSMQECHHILTGEKTETIPITGLPPEARIRVFPGERIPLSGTILRGEALVDESSRTGSAYPVPRSAGDFIHARTFALDASLDIRPSGDSAPQPDTLQACLTASGSETSPGTPDRIARFFFPLVLLIAGISGVVWYTLTDANTALQTSLAVLLIACPCALGFAIPIGLWSTGSILLTRGIRLRNPDALQVIASADTVVLDKTGTLTEINNTLSGFVTDPRSPWTRQQLLSIAAAIQRTTHHPLAALFDAISLEEAPVQVSVHSTRLHPGRGISASVRLTSDQVPVKAFIGRVNDDCDADTRSALNRIREQVSGESSGKHIGIWINETLSAIATVEEHALEEALPLLNTLKDCGLDIHILTGDESIRIADLSPFQTHAGYSPEQKREFIRTLRSQGRIVLFVGDGINDAPAIRAANASITVAGSTPLSSTISDCTLLQANLRGIETVLESSQHAVRHIHENIRISLGYNIAGISIAALGWLNPVVAVLIMLSSSLFVTMRSLQMMETRI